MEFQERFLNAYEGYVAYRRENGTPIILSLCKILRGKPNVDIATIMEEVRLLVMRITKWVEIFAITLT